MLGLEKKVVVGELLCEGSQFFGPLPGLPITLQACVEPETPGCSKQVPARLLLADAARAEDLPVRARARARRALLPVQPRGRVRGGAAPQRRLRRRADPQPGRVDALRVGAARRGRGRGPAGGRVHLSDPDAREEWRHLSVLADVVVARVKGEGVDGYRTALGASRRRCEPRRPRRRPARRARGRCAARHRPGEHPLPDGLHRLERDGRHRARHAPLHHRLPLRRARAVEVSGFDQEPRSGVRASATTAGPRGRCGSASRTSASASASTRVCASCCRTASSWCARAAWSRPSGRARSPPRSRRSGRRGARRRHLRLAVRDRHRRAHGARGRARPRGGDAPARRARAELPLDRRLGRARRAAARRAARRRDRPGVLVTLDLGAEVDGYCSDCTRTWATGEIADDLAAIYDLVLRAGGGARGGASRPDRTRVDAVARDLITAEGHGEHFGHGLGPRRRARGPRGPRLARSATDPLVAGNVVTVEPGVYVPGPRRRADRGSRRRHRRRLRRAERHFQGAAIVG